MIVSHYEWYSLVTRDDPIEQGDIINNIPIIIPPSSLPDDLERGRKNFSDSVDVETYNIVIMTQSCDLIKFGDNDEIIVCPRYDYSEIRKTEPKFDGKGGWKNLINGRIISAHMLNKCKIQGFEFDYQVVNLKRIFSIPLGFVNSVSNQQKNRIRLLPPYREHLAQAFSMQFMRVGLPYDLPRDFPYSN